MQIRPDINSSTILVTLTEANGGIVLGGTKGTVQIVIADTVTAAFTFTTAVYDLDLTDSNGVVTRLLQGVITLDSAVTR
jgi:hypothetical protein